MPVKPCPLHIDRHNREEANRGTPMFPCGGYVTQVDSGLRRDIPWHWHDEVEVLVLCSGTLLLELPGQRHEIRAGEGAFINAGVLQAATGMTAEACELHSLVFHPSLIAGATESAVEQRYVRPLLECSALPAIHFQADNPWQREALRSVAEAFAAFEAGAYGYELLVREKLSHLWLLIVRNNEEQLRRESAASVDLSRMKDMLSFIHEGYGRSISLKDIASAAAISERECLRCFKRTIGQTPMKYLLSHRISVAADLLKSTPLSITEIGQRCGFESPSYFSLLFKNRMEMSPREYRRFA